MHLTVNVVRFTAPLPLACFRRKMSYRLRVTAATLYLPNCLRRSYSACRDALRFLSVSCAIAISRRASRILLRSTRIPVPGSISSGQGFILGCSFANSDLSQVPIAGPLRHVDKCDFIAGLDAEEEDVIRGQPKTRYKCRRTCSEQTSYRLRGWSADGDQPRIRIESVRRRACTARGDGLVGDRRLSAGLNEIAECSSKIRVLADVSGCHWLPPTKSRQQETAS